VPYVDSNHNVPLLPPTELARGSTLVPVPTSLDYRPQSLLAEAIAGPSHEQSLDREVAMATGGYMAVSSTRCQSSTCSFPRESPGEDAYSDQSESERSSPVDLHLH